MVSIRLYQLCERGIITLDVLSEGSVVPPEGGAMVKCVAAKTDRGWWWSGSVIGRGGD